MCFLPTISINGRSYYVDRRLSEIRRVDDPMVGVAFADQADIESLVAATETGAEFRIPALKAQEFPRGHPQSGAWFRPYSENPFRATLGVGVIHGTGRIVACLLQLQELAERFGGIDRLQVFDDESAPAALGFVEDAEGGVTALLPNEF